MFATQLILPIWTAVLVLQGASQKLPHEERQFRDGFSTLQDLKSNYHRQTEALMQKSEGQCTTDKVVIRREWGDLSHEDRERYIAAVYCMSEAPPRTGPDVSPGATNARDDFTVAHIQNSQKVHFSPWLQVWHRAFLVLYEQGLHDCGWDQGQPYWDYSKYLNAPIEQSPLFDGSPFSLGSNGAITPATGNCSCIAQGPFSDLTITLGPIANGAGCRQNPRADGLGFNPRCIERVFSYDSLSWLSYDRVAEAMTNYPNIAAFAARLEKWPGGLHPHPHEFIGGAQDDVPGSCQDPWFWFHHSYLDYLWGVWQAQDYPSRLYALPPPEQYDSFRGPRSWRPAQAVSIDDDVFVSPAFDVISVRQAMNPVGGTLCYMYE